MKPPETRPIGDADDRPGWAAAKENEDMSESKIAEVPPAGRSTKTKGLAALAAIVLCWFGGNYWTVIRSSTGEEAAITVARDYDATTDSTAVARVDGMTPMIPLREVVYVVSWDGKARARVTLSPFLGLGWQMRSYENLSVASAEDCSDPAEDDQSDDRLSQ
jgi:hypothetical protein